MIDLEPVKARLAATTPGRWMIHLPRTNIAIVATDENEYITAHVADRVRGFPDADFITNARSDIAILIAEIERLQKTAED